MPRQLLRALALLGPIALGVMVGFKLARETPAAVAERPGAGVMVRPESGLTPMVVGDHHDYDRFDHEVIKLAARLESPLDASNLVAWSRSASRQVWGDYELGQRREPAWETKPLTRWTATMYADERGLRLKLVGIDATP